MNCGSCSGAVKVALESLPGVHEAVVSHANGSALVYHTSASSAQELCEACSSTGFPARLVKQRDAGEPLVGSRNVFARGRSATKLRHALLPQLLPDAELAKAFAGVLAWHREQQLQEYSRYKNWTQSCYMEVHESWSPQVETVEPLRAAMAPLLAAAARAFGEWYKELYNLEQVEVVTLNSFVTKYVPVEGKNEFGKHVDSAKCDGSLVLALPTDEPHDWPGITVWDLPKDEQGNETARTYLPRPGEALCLDQLVWHHGLPITAGKRYVCVCFYKVKWLKVKGA